jgi:hypothetical protein
VSACKSDGLFPPHDIYNWQVCVAKSQASGVQQSAAELQIPPLPLQPRHLWRRLALIDVA